MRGRTFRRPLTTTRDGRTRGRGGRLSGDDSLTCPPVAAAHRRTAGRGAPAGRSPPAARRLRAGRRPDLRQGRLGRGHGGCRRRLTESWRTHRGRHAHRLRHGRQQRQAGGHRRPRGSVGGFRVQHPVGDRHRRQERGVAVRRRRLGGGRQVRRQVRQAHTGRGGALQHRRPGRQTRPRRGRRLPARCRPLRADVRTALGTGAGHPADLPAVAARGGGHPDQDDGAVAAGVLRPHDGGDRFERAADAGLPQRRPGRGTRARRPSGPASEPRQGTRRHLGDRSGPAGVRRRHDRQLPDPGRRRHHHGRHPPGTRQAVARGAPGGGARQGGRRAALRGPRPGLAGPQRHRRRRLAEPAQGGHRRRCHHGRDRAPRDTVHRLRLAGGRRRRPVDRQGRHLGRRRQGDRPRRQPRGNRRSHLHPPPPGRSAAAPRRSSRTPGCRRGSRAI